MNTDKSFGEQLSEIKPSIQQPEAQIISKVTIVLNDVGCGHQGGMCRFRKGDKGELLCNDFYKYDYKVRIIRTGKIIYFQKEELEVIEDEP